MRHIEYIWYNICGIQNVCRTYNIRVIQCVWNISSIRFHWFSFICYKMEHVGCLVVVVVFAVVLCFMYRSVAVVVVVGCCCFILKTCFTYLCQNSAGKSFLLCQILKCFLFFGEISFFYFYIQIRRYSVHKFDAEMSQFTNKKY